MSGAKICMAQHDNRHYLEANHFSERVRRMWEPIGPADGILTLDLADYVKLDGGLPDGSGPRSSLFSIPPLRLGNHGSTANTVLEVQIPAEDLGKLALRRWNEFVGPNDARIVGAEILRTLVHSDRSFWEIPTILRGSQLAPSSAPVAEGFIAVTTAPSQAFGEAKLSFVFYYSSEHILIAHAQIDSWLSEVSRYLVRRGLADSLVAMVGGEGRSFSNLLLEGRQDLPIPTIASRDDSFAELVPESLMQRHLFHGRHPQIEFGRFMSQVRVPTHPDLDPHFAPLVNQSELVKKLMLNGFAVSWCPGIIDGMPGDASTEPQSLADILPTWASLEDVSFNSRAAESGYWGPYLHIVAEHLDTPAARLDAASGTLLLLYRFKDFITGLETIR